MYFLFVVVYEKGRYLNNFFVAILSINDFFSMLDRTFMYFWISTSVEIFRILLVLTVQRRDFGHKIRHNYGR